MKKKITEEMLSALRASLNEKISPKRLNHILEVEKMASRLGEIYLPKKIESLRAAALLHDVTKELSTDAHRAIFKEYGVEVPIEELSAPKTLHAISGAAIIESEYPDFADDEIICAVRWHTTGRAEMSLFERLIFLADYIDMSRDYSDCVRAREYFFSFDFASADESERQTHLDKTMVLCLDMTIREILERGSVISKDTFLARNDLLLEIKELNSK